MQEQTYNPDNYTNTEWLKTIEYTQEPNRRALLAAFAILGIPHSFLDVGCGDGRLVTFTSQMLPIDHPNPDEAVFRGATSRWICNRGIDIVAPQNPYCCQVDLRKPIDVLKLTRDDEAYWMSPDYEMVISWEVGEHLPLEASAIYADTLANFTQKWLVFTAAIPGQGGDFHINEQQPEFWRELLQERGLTYHQDLTEILRHAWAIATGPCLWLPQNLQVFERMTHDN